MCKANESCRENEEGTAASNITGKHQYWVMLRKFRDDPFSTKSNRMNALKSWWETMITHSDGIFFWSAIFRSPDANQISPTELLWEAMKTTDKFGWDRSTHQIASHHQTGKIWRDAHANEMEDWLWCRKFPCWLRTVSSVDWSAVPLEIQANMYGQKRRTSKRNQKSQAL